MDKVCLMQNLKYMMVVANGYVRGMLIITVHNDHFFSLTVVPTLANSVRGILSCAEIFIFFFGKEQNRKPHLVLVKEEMEANVQRKVTNVGI